MSSTPAGLGKSLSLSAPIPTSTHSPAPRSSTGSPGLEFARRPAQSGGLSSSSSAQPSPRKGQGARKQHRNQRRPQGNNGNSNDNVDLDDDTMVELNAVRNLNSRRGQTSITHLLNYTISSRSYGDYQHYHGHHHGSSSRSYRRNPTWGPGSGYRSSDKARYVHANYRFVVSPKGDYRKQAADADELLDWSDVLQVIASSESQATSCPICLCDPVAPRMAKCGHIFCLPCLIRFVNSSSSDDDGGGNNRSGISAPERRPKWKKCPICEELVYISEVRPVRFYAGQESALPRPGHDVVLRLMVRKANSTLALPRETGVDVLNQGQDVPWHFAANILDYARIIKGTGAYMAEQYDAEIEALLRQEKEDELMFHEDGEWTQRAVKAINTAKDKLAELGGLEVALQPVAEASSSSWSTLNAAAAAAAGATGRSTTARGGGGSTNEPDFYFYTSLPHLYLSPLDIRILKTKYGAFSSFPSTLLPRVEHISTGHSVDDSTRKRAKYLSHLPHGCLISFLECDWTDIVPAEVLASFADEIERRRKRNRDKATQEERERLQAERLEAAAMRGAAGKRTVTVGSASEEEIRIRFGGGGDENIVNPDDFIPLGGTTPSQSSNSHRIGFTELANISTSPSGSRTVWGTPALPPPPQFDKDNVTRRSPPVDDGWLKDDQFLQELAVQMESQSLGRGDEDGEVDRPGTTGGGKKKKKQKITLMSTGGRRGN